MSWVHEGLDVIWHLEGVGNPQPNRNPRRRQRCYEVVDRGAQAGPLQRRRIDVDQQRP
jgi:hypothetical protein